MQPSKHEYWAYGTSGLFRGFPRILGPHVRDALAYLPTGQLPPLGEIVLTLNGEALRVPERIYNPEIISRDPLTATQALIIHCLYSRHHDGYVREKSLRRMLEAHEPWMFPFTLALLNDCVIEIHGVLLAYAPTLASDAYRRACAENLPFVELKKARMVSFWDLHYRGIDPDNYPAFQVAKLMGWWKPSELRWARRRKKRGY